MHRIDTSLAVLSLPTPAAVGPNPNYFFSHGDISDVDNPILPTRMDCDFLNALQEEICYVIEQSGATLDKSDHTQLRTAIQYFIDNGGSGGIGIPDVEADPAPTLGGNLIANGHKIVGADVIFDVDLDIQTANFAVKNKISAASGGTNDYFNFGTDIQDFYLSATNILKINNSGLSILGSTAFTTILDEDDFASDSATATFTQQSGKAYVDTSVAGIQRYLRPDFMSNSVANSGGTSEGLGLNGISGTISQNDGKVICPRDAIFSDLRVIFRPSWNTATTDYVDITLRVNGTPTALTVRIGTTNGPQDVTDTTHTVAVSQGDELDLIFETTETSAIDMSAATTDYSLKYV